MGFERNYQIKPLSKQLNIRGFSTFNDSSYVNPWFWTGLIDAEGSFSVIVDKSLTHKLGWRVQSKFQMGLHKRDLPLLLQLQQNLGGIGSIHIIPTRNLVNYSIDSKKDLTSFGRRPMHPLRGSLITHLEKYSLLTQKAADFILFKVPGPTPAFLQRARAQ